MAHPSKFNELIAQSKLPVLVDFWAEWCGPCRTVAPVMAQVAREYKGRILVVKVNVDDRQQVAAEYGIRSIPTMILFHEGRPIMREQGALPYQNLKIKLDRALAAAGV